MCDKQIVIRPKFKPTAIHVDENNKANEIAVIGSGMVIDNLLIPITINSFFLVVFHIPKQVITPIKTEMGTTTAEMIKELSKESKKASLVNKIFQLSKDKELKLRVIFPRLVWPVKLSSKTTIKGM